MFVVTHVVLTFAQLYDRRKKHLRNEKEREKWKEIDYRFMTEESDVDEEAVAQHKLPWRSESNYFHKKSAEVGFEPTSSRAAALDPTGYSTPHHYLF